MAAGTAALVTEHLTCVHVYVCVHLCVWGVCVCVQGLLLDLGNEQPAHQCWERRGTARCHLLRTDGARGPRVGCDTGQKWRLGCHLDPGRA